LEIASRYSKLIKYNLLELVDDRDNMANHYKHELHATSYLF